MIVPIRAGIGPGGRAGGRADVKGTIRPGAELAGHSRRVPGGRVPFTPPAGPPRPQGHEVDHELRRHLFRWTSAGGRLRGLGQPEPGLGEGWGRHDRHAGIEDGPARLPLLPGGTVHSRSGQLRHSDRGPVGVSQLSGAVGLPEVGGPRAVLLRVAEVTARYPRIRRICARIRARRE